MFKNISIIKQHVISGHIRINMHLVNQKCHTFIRVYYNFTDNNTFFGTILSNLFLLTPFAFFSDMKILEFKHHMRNATNIPCFYTLIHNY